MIGHRFDHQPDTRCEDEHEHDCKQEPARDTQVRTSLRNAAKDERFADAGKHEDKRERRYHGCTGRQVEHVGAAKTDRAGNDTGTPRDRKHDANLSGKDGADDRGHDQKTEHQQNTSDAHRARHHDAEREEKEKIPDRNREHASAGRGCFARNGY